MTLYVDVRCCILQICAGISLHLLRVFSVPAPSVASNPKVAANLGAGLAVLPRVQT